MLVCVCACVCVTHLNRCKGFILVQLTICLFQQGRAAPLAYCTQRSYCHWWEGEADHLPVPAESSLNCWTSCPFQFLQSVLVNGKGLSQVPPIQWLYFFTVATICVFAETTSPTVILIISPKPCRPCLLWLFWKTIAETYFIVDIIFCVINMMILFNFLESDLDSVWQHWMLYIVFEKYYQGDLL